LRANVTQAEAVDAFRGGVAALRWLPLARRLRSVALVYVPFRLYRFEIANGTRTSEAWLALDAVDGSLDPYRFEGPPDAALVEVETRNRVEARLDPERSATLLEDKLRRMVFQAGFFRVRELRFHAPGVPLDLHVPFWLGFYGRAAEARLRVLDAVRRRFEGAKARTLFEHWLAGGEPRELGH
jgi:hypothetical protein